MENTIILNSGQKIEVLFQDEVSLDIDCSLRYIESGKKELDSYTNNNIKPSLDQVVIQAQADMEAQISQGIEDAAQAAETSATEAINYSIAEAKQDIASYVSINITPDLEEALTQAQQYSQSASSASSSCAQSAVQASNSATSAAQSAQEASSTVSTFDAHVTEKQTAFDTHVAEKQSAFDTNATSKTNTFNTNATSKTSTFNDNYTSKLNSFNSNASTKQALVDASAASAAASAENARKWAVGTISEQPQGSAKYWAKQAKVSAEGQLNENMITNCLTAIPQDIKLELNNGTMTLKAGSKVYDGAGNSYIVQKDISRLGITDRTSMTVVGIVNGSLGAFLSIPPEYCYSGATEPTSFYASKYAIWYDTLNKQVKLTLDSGEVWTECTLPIGIQTETQSGYTSIDQVFNGFGYIGSHWYEIKGNEGKARNGRNADGSLNNSNRTTANVIVHACGAGTGNWFMMSDFDGNFRNADKNTYFIQDEMPSVDSFPSKYAVWESPKENIIRITADKGVTWTKTILINCGEYSTVGGSITSFNPKTVFQAAGYNDVALQSQFRVVSILPSTPADNVFYFIPEV